MNIARAARWLHKGPLPIKDLINIIAEYANEFEGKCVREILIPHPVRVLAALPDGKLASCSGDKTIRVWDAASGICLLTLAGHTRPVTTLAVPLDRKNGTSFRLASGSEDKTIRVWDVDIRCSNEGGAAFGACLLTLQGHSDSVSALAVLPDGKLASGSYDNTVRIWDVDVRCSNEGGAAFGACLLTLQGHTRPVTVLAVLPDGKLASGSDDSTVRVWDANMGACLLTLQGHTSWVSALAALPGGKLASGSVDKTIRVWDVASGICLLTLAGHTMPVDAMAVLPDGKLASGSYDNTVRIWDVASGACLLTLQGHTCIVTALAVLPGGKLASGSDDNTIRVWE